jgi:hypothetical protein
MFHKNSSSQQLKRGTITTWLHRRLLKAVPPAALDWDAEAI